MNTESANVEHVINSVNSLSEDCEHELMSRFRGPLLAMTLFEVHYMSWLKNVRYLPDFMERFTCFLDQITTLPEFDDHPRLTDEQIREWLVHKSISQCLMYRRQLVLTFHQVTGLSSKKKFRFTWEPFILELNELKQKNLSPLGNDGAECCSEETEEGNHFTETVDSPLSLEQMMTDDEGDTPSQDTVQSRDDEQIHKLNEEQVDSEMNSQLVHMDIENDSLKVKVHCQAGQPEYVSDQIFLGEVELKEGLKHEITLPIHTNHITEDYYLKLSLMDVNDSTRREYIQIKINEAAISGFSGLRRKFKIKLNDAEQCEEVIGLLVNLKWQIDQRCYHELVQEQVDGLRKLSGLFFALGDYYWHFLQGFYQWAVLHSPDPFVRYTAIQVFHELAVLMSPSLQYNFMTPLYRSMYPPGAYPQPNLLPLPVCECVPESLSRLDNCICIFSNLFHEEQIEEVSALLPHLIILVLTRYRSIKRLADLLRYFIGNYSVQDLSRVVLPFATDLMHYLAQVDIPEEEMEDPRPGLITWPMVNSLASQCCYLVVEAIQCARPQQWASLSIADPDMAEVKLLLNQCIDALFSPNGIAFLQTIYSRLRSSKSLNDSHLAPFLTEERMQQYRDWYQ